MHHNHSRRRRGHWYPLAAGVSIVLAIALAAWTLAGCSSAQSTKTASAVTKAVVVTTTTTTPKPHGPYAVGRRTITFVDRSRPTPPNGSFPGRPTRTLETIVEYPTAGTPDSSHEITGAAPVAGKFPVVIYLHGFSAHADDPYLHPWASAGFVAVAPKFPLTNTDAPGGPSRTDVVHEPADVRFVISQMLHLPARHADLQRVINGNAIGVMGGSYGAERAYIVTYVPAERDPRIKAVIQQSCGCAPHVYPKDISVPIMLFHGTADPFAPYKSTAQDFASAHAPKFFVSFVGAQHIQYDEPWLSISVRASIDFFRRYLENDRTALARLNVDANVPGKARLQPAPA